MPSMRGIEKPHTSASTAATLWPRCASATARFVVTDDLPTPPLPDAIASTRVCESVNGLGRCSWPSSPCVGVTAAVELLRPSAARSSSVMTVRSTSTRSTPGERDDRVGDPLGDLGPERAAGDRQRDRDPDPVAVDLDAPHHVEIDDRRWISGSSTGPEGVEHLGLGGHCGPRLRGISTTDVGRIPAWPDADLTPDEFAAAVAAVTTAFGDPTRRDIYLFVRARADGAKAAEVAERFALHPNVARHHLEKLAARRLPRRRARPPRDRRAGRRSATASPPTTATSRSRPAATTCSRTLLARALERLPVDEARALADEVGYEYGRAIAARMEPTEGHRSVKAAVASVADALDRARLRRARRDARQRAHARRRALPVRRGRAAVPARAVRGRHRHGQGHARRSLRRDAAARSSRVVPAATSTASPASEASTLARAYLDHASSVAAAPGRARRDAPVPRASITAIPAGCTPRAGRRGSRSRTRASRSPRSSAPARARSCSRRRAPRR